MGVKQKHLNLGPRCLLTIVVAMLVLSKQLALEQKNIDNAAGYGRIGKVEYRTEEDEILSTPNWEPAGEVPFD